MSLYPLDRAFVIDEVAPWRRGEPTTTELRAAEKFPHLRGFNRVIGGDQGDLLFDGYDVDGGRTTLTNPTLSTTHEDLTGDEVFEIARAIFDESYASIGIETIF